MHSRQSWSQKPFILPDAAILVKKCSEPPYISIETSAWEEAGTAVEITEDPACGE